MLSSNGCYGDPLLGSPAQASAPAAGRRLGAAGGTRMVGMREGPGNGIWGTWHGHVLFGIVGPRVWDVVHSGIVGII